MYPGGTKIACCSMVLLRVCSCRTVRGPPVQRQFADIVKLLRSVIIDTCNHSFSKEPCTHTHARTHMHTHTETDRHTQRQTDGHRPTQVVANIPEESLSREVLRAAEPAPAATAGHSPSSGPGVCRSIIMTCLQAPVTAATVVMQSL